MVIFPTKNGPLLFSLNRSNHTTQIKTQNTIIQQPKSTIEAAKPTTLQSLTKKQINGFAYYRLGDLTSKGLVKGNTDLKNDVCQVQKGKHRLHFERNIPVVLDTGSYESMPASPVFFQNQCYLPEATAEKLVELSDDHVLEERIAAANNVATFNAKQLANYLSFLHSPIPGAHVSTVNSSLPGAPRTYRHGVHEGLDWYTFGTGKVINKSTPVLSMETGVIVRADTTYKEMTTPARNQLLAIGSKNDGQTPPYILDKMRGRTVWVQYANGVMARYCHLSKIDKHIKVGAQVKPGEIIGNVGNSGTSDGALGNNNGLHLHLDIIIYGNWMWGKYSVADRRMILEKVFNK